MTGFSPFHSWSAASPYALALGLAALLCVVVAGVGGRRRGQPGGAQFALMMRAAAVWALLYSFELTTPALAGKVFWAKTEYLGIVILPVAWFLFARDYTGATKRLSRRLLALISLIPTATVVLAATNGLHGLVWRDVSLSTAGSFPSLVAVHGPWFWVHVVYSYGLLAVGSYVLLRTAFRYPQLYRRQAVVLVIATAAPWVGNGLWISRLPFGGGLDVTPFAFTITGVGLLLAMSRFRLFSLLPALLPTARSELLQKMRDGVLVLDVDGRVVTFNPAATHMLADRAPDLMGTSAAEILGDVVVAPYLTNDGSDSQFEVALGEGDSRRYFDVVSSALGLRGGADMGRLLVLRDVTERKRNEDTLRRTQFSVDHAADSVIWMDPEGHIVDMSDSTCLRLEYTRDELLSMTIFDIDPVFPRDTWPEHWQQIKALGSFTFESAHRTKSGSTYLEEVTTNYVAFGGREYNCSFSHDISERKRIEKELLESEERLRLALVASNQGTWDLDLPTGQTLVSPQYAIMLGYDPVEFHLTLDEFRASLHPDDRERVAAAYDAYLRGDRSAYEVQYRRKTKSGDWKWFSTLGMMIERDETGEPLRMVGVQSDITERVQAEEALRDSERQLRQSQKMEAVGQLAGGIAHDFNNVLTAILGYGDLILASQECASSIREDVEEIKAAAERAAALTRQILAFSRRQALQPEVLSLNQTLANMERLLRRTLGEDIDLITVLRSDLGLVEVDAHQFEQVLLNLALNARDAMGAGGKLTLETANVELDDDYCRIHVGTKPGAHVMLAVSDSGVGMDEETRSHVFEPFFTTKEPGKGTGLGLATVYGTVQQSGGSIFVYSAPGKGTTFKIYLPRIYEPAERQIGAVATPGSAAGGETILVVEDELAVRELVKRVLGRLGYSILAVGSGDEALILLRKADFVGDLLLTDVVLPGTLQGNELARAAGTLRPHLPVLYMSGYTRDAIVHAGRLDEGVNYLEKPFTPDGLANRVREVLDSAALLTSQA